MKSLSDRKSSIMIDKSNHAHLHLRIAQGAIGTRGAPPRGGKVRQKVPNL